MLPKTRQRKNVLLIKYLHFFICSYPFLLISAFFNSPAFVVMGLMADNTPFFLGNQDEGVSDLQGLEALV